MNQLHEHYRLLLGLDANWTVASVELSLEGRRVEIRLEFTGSETRCPDGGATCKRHDLAPERTWRHLDTMQFETILRARTPRANCAKCGVKTSQVPWAEKSSRFTLMFEAFEGRTEESADTLLRTLSPEQRKAIKAVAFDMWQPFLNAIAKHASEAAIVHDKFHVSKHLNEALDQVRRVENKTLRQEGDETLKGIRQLWLYNEPNLTDDAAARFESLKESDLKTARAWAIKEHFRWFWTYHHPGYARQYFDKWYGWASRSRLRPIIKTARMLKRHLDNLLTYTRHKITNSMAEGFNSKIQSIKSNARGSRSFDSYRTKILFFCGKLNLLPPEVIHNFF